MRSARLDRRRSFALCLLMAMVVSASCFAAPKKSEPDPTTNPALAALAKSGAKFFYMGRNAGLDGWVAVKDGQTQVIYKPGDDSYVLVGYLFDPKGENLTAAQVKKLTENNKELAALAATPTKTEAEAPKDPAANVSPADLMLPAGERLLKEMQRSYGVTLGGNEAAPMLYVAISPSAPPCKNFWKDVRDKVQQGALRLRLYPAGLKDSSDEREAARLLTAADPLAAWDKYAGGDATALAGVADKTAIDHVQANTALVTRWKFPVAPYILYRDKAGKVKVVQGAPQKPQDIISDAAPENKAPETKP